MSTFEEILLLIAVMVIFLGYLDLEYKDHIRRGK
jgi:hypothetical protein